MTTDHVPIHPNQIPDLVRRVQQLELEVQRKCEIITQLRDNEAYLKRHIEQMNVLVQAFEALEW